MARLTEVRALLDDEALANHDGVMVHRGDTVTGYRPARGCRGAGFLIGDLRRLPVPHHVVDIGSGLALAHVPALEPGDFLRAALPAGLRVRRCEEPRGRGGDHPPPRSGEPELEVRSGHGR